MGDANELQSSITTKITGEDETIALDIVLEGGQNRAMVSTIERASLAMRTGVVAVSVTATILRVGGTGLAGRRSILIQNVGQQVIYLGASSVTVGTGIALYPKASIVLDLVEDINVYAIASTSGQEARIMELS